MALMGRTMGMFSFSESDRRQMQSLGITEDMVMSQIELFRRSSSYLRLTKPCTPVSGVRRIPLKDISNYLKLHEKGARAGRFQKFVPASGAATRMFQSLLQIYNMPHYLECDELHRRVEQGVSVACDFLRFVKELKRFAFFEELDSVLNRDGLMLDMLTDTGQFRTLLDYVLTDRGLNFASLPKGLLKFHKYPKEQRTAFEEHLIEAAHYLRDQKGRCSLHFTISPEHEKAFLQLYQKAKTSYGERYRIGYEVFFSFQKPSTDTIAVELDNRPFRDRFGHLHFRPGGHGALLENLNDLRGDLVYIKNIDNLCPDHLKGSVSFWKKVLGGYLIELQEATHNHIRKLNAGNLEAYVENAEAFARDALFIQFADGFEQRPLEERRGFLLKKLNRPIRICGVVPNAGHPGGAPFWVEGKDGQLSIQIVEQAQVDFSSMEQHDIWTASTHFNPVDLVCAVRDYRGEPFDLKRFTDPDAVFISRKSKNGRELKALELPGLWNGSMADWITIIVEVPETTFNPVKTIFDLLRPEHQPYAGI